METRPRHIVTFVDDDDDDDEDGDDDDDDYDDDDKQRYFPHCDYGYQSNLFKSTIIYFIF